MVGIALARLGPMLAQCLQDLSAMTMGSVIVLTSDLTDEGGGGLFLRFFLTSFKVPCCSELIFGIFYFGVVICTLSNRYKVIQFFFGRLYTLVHEK